MVASIVPLRAVGSRAAPPLALPALSLSDRLAILSLSLPLSGTLSLLPLRATTMAPATLLGAAARWAVVAYVLRLLRRQQKQEGRLKTASAAGVEGSRFAADLDDLHYVLRRRGDVAPSLFRRPPLLFHFNHGFGSNALTWEYLIAPLADALAGRGVTAVAHDRLGFGLSGRPEEVAKYSSEHNAKLGARLVERVQTDADADDPTAGTPTTAQALGGGGGGVAEAVLVGHSMGAIVSSQMAALLPKARALVLIAPAMLAPQDAPAAAPRRRRATSSAAVGGGGGGVGGVGRLAARGARAVAAPVRSAVGAVALLCLRLLLRCLIFNEGFWRRTLQWSYGSKYTPKEEMLARYRWPAQVRGADVGLCRFVRAQAGPAELRALSADVRDARLPVLILHGTEDRIVPPSNSRALARSLPNATLVELDGCGHTPHEEAPERVQAAILDFLRANQLLD